MPANSRIDDLRRRIERDPASIAFAQLAEEYRRSGDYEAAIRTCRTGLAQHPAYLSARVTLGRALMDLGRHDEALEELEYVLRSAPDNLSAIRALAELHQHDAARINSFEEAVRPVVAASEPVAAPSAPQEPAAPVEAPDPVLAELERWLSAILADRAMRGGSLAQNPRHL